ncbi:MAG: hypothetical protein ACRD4P_02150 [Bryobacteraceae bacterium]
MAQFENGNLLDRLKALDARARRKGLSALDPSRNRLIQVGMEAEDGIVTKNGYGVFNLAWQAAQHPEWPDQIQREIQEIRGGIQKSHGVPLQFLIWAGMGGSAEDKNLYQAAGLLRRGPRCYILDSTDPAKLKYILEDMQRRSRRALPDLLRRTLVVGMAMGMTSYEPVVNLEKLAALYRRFNIDSRANFLYLTPPGSSLDQFAAPRGFRGVALQPDNGNSVAGRHSAPLTRGTLYPLALAGRDLRAWMKGAELADEDVLTAWRLAAFLDCQGRAGRDKVTLILPKALAGAALWTKQNFEESLGKSEELGIKIVIDEKIRLRDYHSPRDQSQDRVFLAVQRKGDAPVDKAKLLLVRSSGYPLAVLTLPAGALLSRYMQFIHYVVFGIAWLRGMNFVTQPHVEIYKSIAGKLWDEAQAAGSLEKTQSWRRWRAAPAQAKWRGITLHYDGLDSPAGACAPEIYASAVKQLIDRRSLEYAEMTFFGDARYSPRGRAALRTLDRAADHFYRARLKMPADVYEGPAMNHSYHEMIMGHGKSFSTVVLPETQERVPGLDYSADYHRAQYLATLQALAQRKRPAAGLTIRNLEPATIASLEEFFREAGRLI